MRAIVSVATDQKFVGCLHRLKRELARLDDRTCFISWEYEVPPNTISAPYAFKISALNEARRRGGTELLWLDSSTFPLRPLKPIWERIEAEGYWVSENWHGKPNGEWTTDPALHYKNSDWTAPEAWPIIGRILGITAEENATIPQLNAGVLGLDMSSQIVGWFMDLWTELARAGAFHGDRGNHRHDQTCMSAIAWKLGMIPTIPPAYFTDDRHQSEDTILVSRRGWAE